MYNFHISFTSSLIHPFQAGLTHSFPTAMTYPVACEGDEGGSKM